MLFSGVLFFNRLNNKVNKCNLIKKTNNNEYYCSQSL